MHCQCLNLETYCTFDTAKNPEAIVQLFTQGGGDSEVDLFYIAHQKWVPYTDEELHEMERKIERRNAEEEQRNRDLPRSRKGCP